MERINSLIEIVKNTLVEGIGILLPFLFIGIGFILMSLLTKIIESPAMKGLYDLIMADYQD